MSDASWDGTGGEPEQRRRRTGAVVGLSLLAAILVAVVVASFWQLPDYALVPGTALNADQLVTVPHSVRHSHRGSVFLTDVDLVQLRAIDYLFYRWNSDDTIEPDAAVTGPATAAQYVTQGTIDMATARQAATVVGLDELGYRVRAVPTGVIVYQPDPGSPAASALADDDVIVGANGHQVTTFQSLTNALHDPAPGTTVHLVVRIYGQSKTQQVTVRLGEERGEKIDGGVLPVCVALSTRTSLPPYDLDGKPYGCLGLYNAPDYSEIDYRTSGLPFPVSMDPNGIIGPSAGLAYTLALMEQLDPDDLTGGHRIAATGTMSVTGQVGDVGGVAQKTVAVRNAGATVFFVPTPELATAKAHAGGQLRIFAVSSIGQVLSDLERIGGRIARPASAKS